MGKKMDEKKGKKRKEKIKKKKETEFVCNYHKNHRKQSNIFSKQPFDDQNEGKERFLML